jgi:predicted site-specific integrase-resolvase
MPEPDDLLTSAELAEALRVNERTVRKWRNDGTGPPVMWAGGHARYLWRDVLDWLRRKDEPPPPCRGSHSQTS